METKSVAKHDYKKWLSYSFDSSDPKKLFNLYKALDAVGTSGMVRCKNAIQHEDSVLYISCEQLNEDLLIKESAREEFKKYLIENYFRTTNIDQWYIEKIDGIAKEKNFSGIKDNNADADRSIVIKPHPKEIFYLNIRIVVSVFFYLSFVTAIILTFITNPAIGIMLLFVIPVILTLMLINTFFAGLFTGYVKGNSIRITSNQYPEIYAIVKEEAKKLHITELPDIYVTEGPFNAFVMSFVRSKILMLYSGVVETGLAGNYDVIRFVIAHELCHIKRKHSFKRKILFPSNIIPFLYNAYSRGCEYTCDRSGFVASQKGAIEGVLIMTTGKEIYSRFNIEQHIQDAIAGADFWTWLNEKFHTHPHHYKRLTEIKEYSKQFA